MLQRDRACKFYEDCVTGFDGCAGVLNCPDGERGDLMPRNMSFALTTEKARNRTKTVTRRNGWWFLRPGDIVQQVVKGMGLKKGEKVEKIHLIEIVGTRSEALNRIDQEDCAKEGFPELTPAEFIAMYRRHNGGGDRQIVNRIEFKYLD